MKFSIICPVYNCKEHLGDAVLSVKNQTYKEWELFLVDDGSSDGSEKICDSFAVRDNRIKVLHKKNNGQMNARIDGIKSCAGEYILFLDSDDFLQSQSLEVIFKYLSKYNYPDSILFNANIFCNDSTILAKTIPTVEKEEQFVITKDIYSSLFANQIFGYLWMYSFKRTVLLRALSFYDIKFLNVKYTEDLAFIFNVASKMRSIVTISEYLYNYRQVATSISHNLTLKDRRDRFEIFDYIYSSKPMRFVELSKNTIEIISWSLISYLRDSSTCKDKGMFYSDFCRVRNSYSFELIGSKRIWYTKYQRAVLKLIKYNQRFLLRMLFKLKG